MCTGEDKQLEAFARFIKFAELRPNLERKDWTGFAKRYNGPIFVSSPVLCHARYKTGDISLNGYNMNNRTIAEYVK